LAAQQFHRERPNVIRLRDLSWQTSLALCARIDEQRSQLTADELLLYEDLCLYALFARYELSLYELAIDESGQARKVGFIRPSSATSSGCGRATADVAVRLERRHGAGVLFSDPPRFSLHFPVFAGSFAADRRATCRNLALRVHA